MTTNWIRTLTLSAAALTMGSAAYAQDRLVAHVPFSFWINGTEMPAGSYSIDRPSIGVRSVVQVNDGRHNKIAMGTLNNSKEPGAAHLVFSCGETSGCRLAELWDGSGAQVKFPTPKLTSAEKERLAVVIIRKSEAD
jgi:hypothetical protein